MANNPSEVLRKLLMVDLVDWSREEVNTETVDIPLIIDPSGRPLAKVGDLPRMYPGYKYDNGYKRPVWFDYEDDEDTDFQDKTSSASDYYDSLVNSYYGEKDSEFQGSKISSTLD
ncbi:hypothetical protein Clacol_008594 [Clathrus columnatus]|uniref:Uncharacterized protein n=1 Tax=Clathrus columnatus TaxID=1419009 RepID=A0AAV5ANC2_9AGAM|nr:hypothetical protein Clacol_008594 [Clathrus columnatus]